MKGGFGIGHSTLQPRCLKEDLSPTVFVNNFKGVHGCNWGPSINHMTKSNNIAPQFVSIQTAARQYDLKEDTLRYWVRHDMIPSYLVNGLIRLKLSDFENLVIEKPKHCKRRQCVLGYGDCDYVARATDSPTEAIKGGQ